MREYLLCLLAAAAVTYLTVPIVRLWAVRFGFMAEVRDRDVHAEPTPRLGGLAMVFGLLAGLLLASKLPMMKAVFRGDHQWWALLSGVAIIVLLGIIDDRWPLNAPIKLVGQIAAAVAISVQGITVTWLPFAGGIELPPMIGTIVTVLIVLVSINAINFVDGLDGLAAGIVAISAGAFFAYSYLLSVSLGIERATLATLVSATLVGMCLGFLPSNTFPARIFMGDTGSMTLGLLLASATITLTGQVGPADLGRTSLLPALLPVILPVAVMAVPLIDLLLAVIRRTRAGRSPFAPDKQHLHHRLLELGHSQRRAVVLLYAWTGLVAFTAVAVAFIALPYALLAFAVGLALLVWAVRRPGKQPGITATAA